jgi:hypothetical protein
VNILRYIILSLSIAVILIWALFGRIQGSTSDLLSIVLMLFFAANAFYIFFSKPNFKLSDFFDRAATGLALATLEVKYQATQAKSKELEAERLRAETEEKKADRLNAAKEFMKFAANNPHVKKHFELAGKDIPDKDVALTAPQLTTDNKQLQFSRKTSVLSRDNPIVMQ